jgi:hypothetical protein
MIPLKDVILYAPNSYPNGYWAIQRNTTEWSVFMTELVLSGNALTKLMLQALPLSLQDAHIGWYLSMLYVENKQLIRSLIDRDI